MDQFCTAVLTQQERKTPEKPKAQSDLELEIADLRRETRKWARDISSVWTQEGWLCLALAILPGPMADIGALLDLHFRRVVGGEVSNQMTRDTVAGRELLRLREAMDEWEGNCQNTAAVETVFKTVKVELIWCCSWPTQRASELADCV